MALIRLETSSDGSGSGSLPWIEAYQKELAIERLLVPVREVCIYDNGLMVLHDECKAWIHGERVLHRQILEAITLWEYESMVELPVLYGLKESKRKYTLVQEDEELDASWVKVGSRFLQRLGKQDATQTAPANPFLKSPPTPAASQQVAATRSRTRKASSNPYPEDAIGH